MSALGQDLRLGARGFLRNPGLTALTVVVLALGIGANTAIFSVVDAMVVRPLPFPAPEQLVVVPSGVMYPDFADVRQQSRSFSALAAYRLDQTVLTGSGEPDTIPVVAATPELFDLLGVGPALGRGLQPGENQPGRPPVAVISHRLWQQRLGGDPGAVGRSLTLDGRNYQVVGVMPSVFRFPLEDGGGDVWIPLWGGPPQQPRQWRGFRALRCIGRLAPGVTLTQAQFEVAGIAARLAQQYPKDNAGRGFATLALYDRTVKVGRPALLVLLGAVALVLLVACANVANLQLVRAAARRREIAVRVALGAGRGRIIRQFLTESALLTLLGAVVGVVIAFWGAKLLASRLPDDLLRLDRIALDGRVLVYTLVVSAVTALAVGLATALQASGVEVADALKQGDRGTSTGRQRLRSLLLVSEIALALTLLVGAGLLVRSFERLVNVDPGFNPRGLLTARVIITSSSVPPPRLYADLMSRMQSLPGVTSAAIASQVPFSRWFGSWNFTLDDRPEPPADNPWWTNVRNTSPEYLRTMGIALVHGRGLERPDEQSDQPQVAVINHSFARRYFPGANPLGRHIRAYDQYDLRIVGVVADTLGTCGFAGCAGVGAGRLDRSPDPEIHIPMRGGRTWYLVLRTAGDPRAMIGPLRKAIYEMQPNMPLSEIQSLEASMEQSLGQRRAIMFMFSLFAVLALGLAVVGLYGVMSYSVAQRTREIGVRMALGALASDVQKLVVAQGLRLCLIGLAVGLLSALALTQVMDTLLFGVSTTDPLTFGGLSVLLLAVAALAALLPARRATRIDPMIALRSE